MQNTIQQLYDCKIQIVGHQVINRATLLYGSSEIHPSEVEKVYSIELPEGEFNKFCNDHKQFLLIKQAIKNNPILQKEFEKFLTLSTLVQ